MDFYSRSGKIVDECTRSAILARSRSTYEVRRVPCLWVCVSGVGGTLERKNVGETLRTRGMPT